MRIDETAWEISQDTIREAAEFYVVLSSGEATEADVAACHSWRAASPHNEQAWQQLQFVDSLFGNLSGLEKRALVIHQARRDQRRRTLGVIIIMTLVGIIGLLVLPSFMQLIMAMLQ